METKKHIRNYIFSIRKNIDKKLVEDESNLIFQKLLQMEDYINASILYVYMDFRNEVKTNHIIEHALTHDKKVAIPKIIGDEMHFYFITGLEDTKKGFYDILEPTTSQLATSTKEALMLMPGVAFDRFRNRIGYGKGFYDRYLDKYQGLNTIGLAFDYQIFISIPWEKVDVRPHKLVTPTRIIS